MDRLRLGETVRDIFGGSASGEIQQSGRLPDDGGAQEARPADEQSAKTNDDSISDTQVRRSFAAAIQDEMLMADQYRLGDHPSKPAGLGEPDSNLVKFWNSPGAVSM